jgi:hypothetical protein
MPVNKEMMAKLKEQYGDKKGRNIYYALEKRKKLKKVK